jgi:hypothetical protein
MLLLCVTFVSCHVFVCTVDSVDDGGYRCPASYLDGWEIKKDNGKAGRFMYVLTKAVAFLKREEKLEEPSTLEDKEVYLSELAFVDAMVRRHM